MSLKKCMPILHGAATLALLVPTLTALGLTSLAAVGRASGS